MPKLARGPRIERNPRYLVDREGEDFKRELVDYLEELRNGVNVFGPVRVGVKDFRGTEGLHFIYNASLGGWLSLIRNFYTFTKSGAGAAGSTVDMDIGQLSYVGLSVPMPRQGVVVGGFLSSSTAAPASPNEPYAQVYKNGVAQGGLIKLKAGAFYRTRAFRVGAAYPPIDFNAGNLIAVKVTSPAAASYTDALCMIEVAWKEEFTT